jgi:hypothetical protein
VRTAEGDGAALSASPPPGALDLSLSYYHPTLRILLYASPTCKAGGDVAPTFGKAAASDPSSSASGLRIPVCLSRKKARWRGLNDGDFPITAAICPNGLPSARRTAISSRSVNVNYRPMRSRPRRGRTPPASIRSRFPVRLLVPSGSTAPVMKSPACILAQNS